MGLAAALEAYVAEWSKYTGCKSEFFENGLDRCEIPDEIATNIYRITQEALNNIAKHSQATQATVQLEQRQGTLSVVIDDNGCGFVAGESARRAVGDGHGLGLLGMRERAAVVGGDIQVESHSDKGTTIFVRVPISSENSGSLSARV
jgi:signal transduction histidine kinase